MFFIHTSKKIKLTPLGRSPMKHNKLFLAFALAASTALVGCGGEEGDDVTINIGSSAPTPTPTPSPTPTPVGDCALVEEADFVSFNNDCSVGTISGVIDSDYELISDVEWVLDGEVLVGAGNVEVADAAAVQAIKDAGVVLTIEAGTEVKALDDGSLLVTRGSQLIADGTETAPITFSSIDSNYDGYGEWGGVIIQGFAPQYGPGNTGACFGTGTVCNVVGEGGTVVGRYGGNEEDDNSGIIRYVRIAEGGLVAGPNNEINGLTLQGVGHGTVVEYVHVHNNLDDGIEWFGGTVNAKYVVLTNNDDDDIDFDEGYQGNIQYAIIQKDPNKEAPTGSNDPRGIEANSSDDEYVPQTEAVLSNVTVIGSTVNNVDGGQQPGMRLRGSLTTQVFNSAVQGFDTGCIRIDDSDVNGDGSNIVPSDVSLTNVLTDCEDGAYDRRVADAESNIVEQTFTLSSTYAIQEEVAELDSAPTIVSVDNGSNFVFDETRYIGAVDPASATGWWEGWTLPDTLTSADPVETSFAVCNGDVTVCTLQGTIDEDYRLVRGVEWVLDGEVIVGAGNVTVSTASDVTAIQNAGVTLTIDAGVHVRAEDDGSLLVTRGSVLEAVGTKAAPITFSSNSDEDFDGLGEWGGIIIQGFAPQYGAGNTGACFGTGTVCNVVGEGGTVVGNYGGNIADDYSGTLRYVRIAEGGLVAGPNNEINGLTLQGVGHATTLEYIQVHGNLDDGIEWFGGTVNAKYLVLTNNDDDSLDYDEGYQGNIQHAIIRMDQVKAAPTGSNDPRGIEANSSDDEYVPQTEATLANILVIGGPLNEVGGEPGLRLRGALTTDVYNTAVTGFNDQGCVRVDNADINGDGSVIVDSTVNLTNVIGECTAGFYRGSSAANVDSETGTVGANTVTIDSAYALTDAAASVAEVTPVAVDNGSGFTFDATSYIGAVAPGTAAADAWWADWIIPGSLD